MTAPTPGAPSEPEPEPRPEPLPVPALADLRALLVSMGLDPCVEHAPDDVDEEISGLLGSLLATTQQHVLRRRRHADTIDLAYHSARRHFGAPPCECGSHHDRPEEPE